MISIYSLLPFHRNIQLRLFLYLFFITVFNGIVYAMSFYFKPSFIYRFNTNLIFGLVLLFIFFLYHRNQLAKEKYVFSFPQFGLFLSCSILFLVWFISIKFFTSGYLILNKLAFILLLSKIAYFLMMLFLFVAIFQWYFLKKYTFSLSIFVMLLQIFYIAGLMLWEFEDIFTSLTSKLVHVFLSLFYTDLSVTSGIDPLLQLKNFSVTIGAPCSGIESLSLFTVIAIFVCVYDWVYLDKQLFAIYYVIGLIGMYGVNVMRVVLLTIIGTYNPRFALTLFHANAGWILFVGYVFIYAYLFYPKMLRER